MATEKELRNELVNDAKSFLGAKQGSAKHKAIINTFNKVKPDGWAMLTRLRGVLRLRPAARLRHSEPARRRNIFRFLQIAERSSTGRRVSEYGSSLIHISRESVIGSCTIGTTPEGETTSAVLIMSGS